MNEPFIDIQALSAMYKKQVKRINNSKHKVISSTQGATSEKNYSKYRDTLEAVKMIYD